MPSKDLTDFVNDPNFIPGIYNYCDRWCERCSFSNRCSVYAIEREDIDDPETRDFNNKKFWNKLASIFQQTKEMLLTWAEEHGVDLLNLDEIKEEHHKRRKDVRAHPLSVAGEAYAFAVRRWFEEHYPDSERQTLNHVDADGEGLAEAIDVIYWYQYFIAVKTMRGISSRLMEQEDEESFDFPLDSDGSIKVALIAIDRSIGAWRLMQLVRTDLSDSIVALQLRLERLRREIEAEFPNARDFIRAGFDEPSVAIS